jgi:general stress protein 26
MYDLQSKKLSIGLMKVAEVAYLSTITSDGFPETRVLLNLKNEKQFPDLVSLLRDDESDLKAYFTTNTSSYKMKNITENPKVCVYYCKEDERKGLMLSGIIEIITDMELKKAFWHNNWIMFFPEGATDPDYTLLRLKPTVAKGYHQGSTYKLEF